MTVPLQHGATWQVKHRDNSIKAQKSDDAMDLRLVALNSQAGVRGFKNQLGETHRCNQSPSARRVPQPSERYFVTEHHVQIKR